MRTMCFLCRLLLPAALLLGGLSLAAARVSDEARQACTPDAMRLCSEFIPDAGKVKTCMLRRRSQLSEACLVAMRGGRGRRPRVYRVRRVVHARHPYHHYYHHHHG